MAVGDYSTTPASNTTISGIDINENCSPAGLNNAIRQLMADLATYVASAPDATALMPKAAGTFSGTQPIYTGRGAYLHHNSSSFTSGRIFLQASGGSAPAAMVSGDILLEY